MWFVVFRRALNKTGTDVVIVVSGVPCWRQFLREIKTGQTPGWRAPGLKTLFLQWE